MGSNKKLKREIKKESKTPVKEDSREPVVAVYSILSEVLDEVVAWGLRHPSEENLSSSTEEEEEANEGREGWIRDRDKTIPPRDFSQLYVGRALGLCYKIHSKSYLGKVF